MAIVPETFYPGQANAADADYPLGSAKNVSSPGAGDGTPFDEDYVNDQWGFLQKLLDAGGVTPSGVPDTVAASDYYAALLAVVDARILAKASARFPVGSIHISTLSANPSTYLGFGTWTAWGAGRTIIGVNAGDTDFNPVEKTGGSKTVPRDGWGKTGGNFGTAASGRLIVGSGSAEVSETLESVAEAGGDRQSLPPYITAYMWKRTA